MPPPTTMLGGLYRYLRDADPAHFQPMNANFGFLEPLEGKVKKDRKKELLVERRRRISGVFWESSVDGRHSVMIHHEGTKDTKDHRATPLPNCCRGVLGRASCNSVSFVPSW